MRLDSISVISGAVALVGALLLVPAAGGADSHLDGESTGQGQVKSDAGAKATKEMNEGVEDVDRATKDGVKAVEKDVDSMLTKDGKPRPDDPFALKPEGEAGQGEK